MSDEKRILLEVMSPEHNLVNTKVLSVKMPGTAGSFAVFPMHAPLISSLTSGTIEYDEEGEKKTINIRSGFVTVLNDNVSICVEL